MGAPERPECLGDAVGHVHPTFRSGSERDPERHVPRHSGPETDVHVRLMGRVGVIVGQFTPVADRIRQAPPATTDTNDLGRYLALTSCTECHGQDFRGKDPAPDLRVIAAYDQPTFIRFMRTGTAVGGRELGLMSRVARSRFSHFTDDEVAALYGYLRGVAGQAR